MKKTIWIGMVCIALFIFIFNFDLLSAQTQENQATVCCQETKTGAFCQNVPAGECALGSPQAPTNCDSTSFCRAGTCFDSSEGTCLENTPQIVCNENGGIWSQESPPQCNLGCCVLGDQAAFVTQTRCKALSGNLGLETNYNSNIGTEFECIQSVNNQDRGACVFESEFERTCDFTTRTDCNSRIRGEFFEDVLCSAEELGTNCGPSTQTICLPGKDGVYFIDTCGNPTNVYDASKISDKEYWTNVKTPEESCSPSQANAGSTTCGNCNYLLGSVCRDSDVVGDNARHGDFICADLNCVDENNRERLHGESWCVTDDKKTGDGTNSVGSRFYRNICQNGEIVPESCGDFRTEICVEDSIETSVGKFSQAACRVNRWQDCLAQIEREDCENTDRRDCFWQEGITLGNETIGGTCLPQNSPGLNFWDSDETRTICGQGNVACVVTFEKGLFGGEECVENCECLTEGWERDHANLCVALGDCGPGINIAGKQGFSEGFEKRIEGLSRVR